MTREERLLEAAGHLQAAFEVLGKDWPLLAVQVSHVQTAVHTSLRMLEERAA